MPLIVLGNNLYLASQTYSFEYKPVAIIADSREEALSIARKYFNISGGNGLVTIEHLEFKKENVDMNNGEIKSVFAVTKKKV